MNDINFSKSVTKQAPTGENLYNIMLVAQIS